MSKMVLVLALAIVLGDLFLAQAIPVTAQEKVPLVVGGNCTYKNYSGMFAVVSITDQPGGNALVNFTFVSLVPLNLTGTYIRSQADITGRIFPMPANYLGLKCLDGIYPVNATIAKTRCGLQPGAVFGGTLSVIERGTCSPITFTFDAIGINCSDCRCLG